MSNPRDRRNKTVLEEALGLEPERVIERSTETNCTSGGLNLVPNLTPKKKTWNPSKNPLPEKCYYDLQDVLDWFAAQRGFSAGRIEGDKVVIFKEAHHEHAR